MKSYERLGVFYMGRPYEVEGGRTQPEPLLYDARDLLTHGLIVGMTGSGKTGLGISLIEEAAIDRIPALVVDPKGDMANLLLQFPSLEAAEFEPWIDAADAARAGRAVSEQASWISKKWRDGLAEWEQDPERIRMLQESADFAIYTPGSTAGRPLAILASLAAPPAEVRGDPELLAERVNATSAAILSLLGIDFDPVQSRESILVANLLQHAWMRGEDLSLETLVGSVQSPPFERLGVLDLETFYPSKERARLALALNALLASPSFAAWLTGEPLDVQRLLWTAEGKPRVSVISIAHLSDRERTFFVALLLAELLSWMRSQSGTSSLRALFYMDEVFGFFPPSAEPPTKRPMLTLLKQARAFGLGIVLATQNPVDLDYKGLSNCGTWFLGRLQTERDKLRVLDGLEGALSAGGKSFDRAELDRLLSSLGPRVFLMSNVHADGPVLFQTRWVLSWLRGPMTRQEIRRLAESRGGKAGVATVASTAAPTSAESAAPAAARERAQRAKPAPAAPAALETVVLPDGVAERFLARAHQAVIGASFVYRPALALEARLHFVRAPSKVDVWQTEHWVVPVPASGTAIEWQSGRSEEGQRDLRWLENGEKDLTREGLTPAAGNAKTFERWRKELLDHLYQTRTLGQWSCKSEKLLSKLNEGRGDFLLRCREAQRARRDEAVDKLRKKYASKVAALEERVRQSAQRVEKEEEQYRDKRTSSWLTTGANLIGALFGRSPSANARGASSSARAASAARKEKADIERAEEDLEVARKALQNLNAEVEREVAVIQAEFQASDPDLEPIVIRPKKSDLDIGGPTLLWRPWRVEGDGSATPAW